MMTNEIKLDIFEVLEKVAAAKKKADKISILRKYESFGLRTILQGCYNPAVQLKLPEGVPPYTACDPHNAPSSLLRKARDMQYFVGKKADDLGALKRETMFVSLLEGIHPEDAKIVLQMKDKKPFKGISSALVKEAFPSIMPPD
jgi:hypothetical protein